jgi:hypothetical protein
MSSAALFAATIMGPLTSEAQTGKTTECTKIGICYCVSAELKPAIESRIARFRQLATDARAAGKAVGYLSVPLSAAGGGYGKLNFEVAAAAKSAVEKRYGADFVWIMDPGSAEQLPNGSGADYMLLWTSVLEGSNGLGEDLDFVYFAGPLDFARVFGLDGNGDMAKIDKYFEQRLKTDPDLQKAVQGGLTKGAFRIYYGLRASSTFSRGAHDEWNIIRLINERRRTDPKLGIPNQLPVLFDGRGVPSADSEAAVSEGYIGKCK